MWQKIKEGKENVWIVLKANNSDLNDILSKESQTISLKQRKLKL